MFTGALYLQPAPEAYNSDDAPDEMARRVASRCWPAVIVVNAPPDSGGNISWLAWGILKELGKEHDLHGSTAAGHESWALAEIWLRAHRTSALIVLGAEALSGRLWRMLARLTTAGELTVLLVNATHTLVQSQRRLLHRAGPFERTDHMAFSAWAELQLHQRRAEPQAMSMPFKRFPSVPADEVPFFRERCRELLSNQDFTTVDDAYLEAFRQARAWLANRTEPLLEEDVGEFLARLVRTAADLHEKLTRLRGAQAGFWRNEWHLKVRVNALVAAHSTEPVDLDAHQAVRTLNGYVAPQIAALGVLALRTRLPPARLAMFNCDHLDRDCRELELDGESLAFAAEESALLRAQLLSMTRLGHPPDGPLFCRLDGSRMPPKALQQRLRRAAKETGLQLTQAWSPPVNLEHGYWMRRRGLSIQSFAGRRRGDWLAPSE